MRYGSVCSGIEAATVAWHPLGWTPAFFSEIEAFPRAVLAHHYPDVPLHGDFTTIQGDEYGPIDLLVGGTPCQSFSVAGLRGGLADDRGNLALQFLRLAQRTRARWLVWENVPGVLSSNGGRDFGAILGGMVELGYGFAYRVLDAQFFGVPQRRRRVFVVGYLGDWRRAAAVLFERHSLSGDPAPRREKGQDVAGVPSRSSAGGGLGTDFDCGGGLIAFGGNNTRGPLDVATACNAHGGPAGRLDFESETFVVRDASEDGTGRGTPLVPVPFNLRGREDGAQPETDPDGLASMRAASGGSSRSYIAFSAKDHGADASDISPTLRSGGHDASHANGGVMPAVAFADCFNGEVTGDIAPTMGTRGSSSNSSGPTLIQRSAVRRLTPRECERLQGFPDDYTLIPYRGKDAADGPRYKALGNSMAVPVMAYIGRRIAMVEALAAQQEAA